MPPGWGFGQSAPPGGPHRSGRHSGPSARNRSSRGAAQRPHVDRADRRHWPSNPAYPKPADPNPADPNPAIPSPSTFLANPRRRVARRDRVRRVGAALLVGLAALLTLSAVTRDQALPAGAVAGRPTAVFTRVVAAGSTVSTDDVAMVDVPSSLRPEHAFANVDRVVGQVVATAVEPGEVATRSRLVTADLLAGQPVGRVAMTVPVMGVAGTGVRAGARVDLYTTGTGEQAASDVVVLAVSGAGGNDGPAAADAAWGQPSTPRLTLALDPSAAARVAKRLGTLEAGESLVLALRRPQASGQ